VVPEVMVTAMFFTKLQDKNIMNDLLDTIRSARNRILVETDWTQMSDSPLTNEKKQEWANYRQALRDLPNSIDDISVYVNENFTIRWQDIPWPTRP
jgi:hypothetical protein